MDEREPNETGEAPEPAPLPPAGSELVARDEPDQPPEPEEPPAHERPTRASGVWAAVVAGLVVLSLLLVFILQNTGKVKVTLFSAHWRAPLGVELLIGAVIGGFVVVFAGAARILELRRRARAETRRGRAASRRARSAG